MADRCREPTVRIRNTHDADVLIEHREVDGASRTTTRIAPGRSVRVPAHDGADGLTETVRIRVAQP